MFNYGSDIAVLHGAFLSISKQNLSLVEAAKCIEQQITVYCATHDDESTEGIPRRINAALFTTLIRPKTSPIKCDDFESVHDLFPNLSWDLYFNILMILDWNKYFQECLSQVDGFTFNLVVKQGFMYTFEDVNACSSYLNHSLIQAILNHPPNPDGAVIFQSCLKMLEQYEKSDNFYAWTLDTLKCLTERCLNEIANTLVSNNSLSTSTKKKFQRLPPDCDVLNDCLMAHTDLILALYNIFNDCTYNFKNLNKVKECLSSLDGFTRCVFCFKDDSFSSDEFDQIQVIKYNLEKMLPTSDSMGSLEIFLGVKEDMKCIHNFCVDITKDEGFTDNMYNRERRYLEYYLAGATVYNTLKALLLSINKGIVVQDPDEARKVYLDACCEEFVSISYSDKIELLLQTLGAKTQCLRLKNYRKLLTTFLNQTVEGDFQTKLFYLCLQSPFETVQYIIEHVINIGQTPVYIQMLSFMAPICKSVISDEQTVLAKILHKFIKMFPKLVPKEQQNFITLVKDILKLSSDESILDVPIFFNSLLSNFDAHLDVTLVILKEIFDWGKERNKSIKSISKYSVVVLVALYLKLMNNYIISRNANIRNSFLESLDSLKAIVPEDELHLNDADRLWLSSKLKTSSLLIQLGAAKFFNYYTANFHFDKSFRFYVLCSCIGVEVPLKNLAKKDFLTELAKLLTYITKDEWILAFKGLLKVTDQFDPFNSLNNVQELLKEIKPTDQNKILALFVDALIVLAVGGKNIPWQYMINSFTTLVKAMFLEQDLNVDEVCILSGQIVYLSNEVCSNINYVGKMRKPLSNLLLHLVSQFKTIPNVQSLNLKILEIVTALLKDDDMKATIMPNIV